MFDEIPVEEHDVFMDKVVTESAVYEGRGRESRGEETGVRIQNLDS
jgi:5-formyltetrahydrofolate cyclo-ligase